MPYLDIPETRNWRELSDDQNIVVHISHDVADEGDLHAWEITTVGVLREHLDRVHQAFSDGEIECLRFGNLDGSYYSCEDYENSRDVYACTPEEAVVLRKFFGSYGGSSMDVDEYEIDERLGIETDY